MTLQPLNDIFIALRPAMPAGARGAAPSATLTAVYSGRDAFSRRIDGDATLGDLADMLLARGYRYGSTLTYVRIILDTNRLSTRRL
ncbi:MAG: hypothetical protein K0S56_812 [Microvirga sp.]|jgi:hypothetical protein|nr:hypothetical protein [Microvirga sp.]